MSICTLTWLSLSGLYSFDLAEFHVFLFDVDISRQAVLLSEWQVTSCIMVIELLGHCAVIANSLS